MYDRRLIAFAPSIHRALGGVTITTKLITRRFVSIQRKMRIKVFTKVHDIKHSGH